MNQDCRRTVGQKQDCRRSPVCHHAPSETLRDVCFVSSWGTQEKRVWVKSWLRDREASSHMSLLRELRLSHSEGRPDKIDKCGNGRRFPVHLSPSVQSRLVNDHTKMISRKTDGNIDNRSVACRLTDSDGGGHMRSLSDRSLPVANLSSVRRLPGDHTPSVRANCSPLSSDKLINVWAIPIYGLTIIFS
ncbi:hypothetical protein LSTR_LSTR000410 [Laodelphax striatellus]|uniref:Uncharacterized protein n=1 Tax=Laodelphax striatellus TaxID=195883 RepID=A0A482X5H2_LAOST|nr:hypothetical protein LSTR_LSTR000410 [Laodelphax striatellus]